MTKRLKGINGEETHEESVMTNTTDPSASHVNNVLQPVSNDLYHTSICGSILYPPASNSSSEIFSYLRHGRFDAFRRSINIYHKNIIQMKNEYGQTVLHILTIHAYQYHWVRFLLMQECDPCCRDNDGYTPAHYAVERDDVEMLRALTTRFDSKIKIFSEEKITSIHEHCLESLSIREKRGMTVFMLCCQHESLKCLNLLLELKINDANLKDNFGETCLYYAVARRNEILVNILINQCQANINDGDTTRPSVLDVLQFNREQQKPFDRTKDDSIEQILLTNNAVNRCQIRRIINKRKRSVDHQESILSNIACLGIDSVTSSDKATAKNYAQIALTYENTGDIDNAHEYYKRAMNSVSNEVLDWTDYAFHVAITHIVRGEKQLALDLLQQVIVKRKQFENESEQIDNIQRMIDNILIT